MSTMNFSAFLSKEEKELDQAYDKLKQIREQINKRKGVKMESSKIVKGDATKAQKGVTRAEEVRKAAADGILRPQSSKRKKNEDADNGHSEDTVQSEPQGEHSEAPSGEQSHTNAQNSPDQMDDAGNSEKNSTSVGPVGLFNMNFRIPKKKPRVEAQESVSTFSNAMPDSSETFSGVKTWDKSPDNVFSNTDGFGQSGRRSSVASPEANDSFGNSGFGNSGFGSDDSKLDGNSRWGGGAGEKVDAAEAEAVVVLDVRTGTMKEAAYRATTFRVEEGSASRTVVRQLQVRIPATLPEMMASPTPVSEIPDLETTLRNRTATVVGVVVAAVVKVVGAEAIGGMTAEKVDEEEAEAVVVLDVRTGTMKEAAYRATTFRVEEGLEATLPEMMASPTPVSEIPVSEMTIRTRTATVVGVVKVVGAEAIGGMTAEKVDEEEAEAVAVLDVRTGTMKEAAVAVLDVRAGTMKEAACRATTFRVEEGLEATLPEMMASPTPVSEIPALVTIRNRTATVVGVVVPVVKVVGAEAIGGMTAEKVDEAEAEAVVVLDVRAGTMKAVYRGTTFRVEEGLEATLPEMMASPTPVSEIPDLETTLRNRTATVVGVVVAAVVKVVGAEAIGGMTAEKVDEEEAEAVVVLDVRTGTMKEAAVAVLDVRTGTMKEAAVAVLDVRAGTMKAVYRGTTFRVEEGLEATLPEMMASPTPVSEIPASETTIRTRTATVVGVVKVVGAEAIGGMTAEKVDEEEAEAVAVSDVRTGAMEAADLQSNDFLVEADEMLTINRIKKMFNGIVSKQR
uniref:Uncharacterized protein n=1 Tax=Globodera rostochiensis TaxID=31243 RepID=A0A914HF76_GLORO